MREQDSDFGTSTIFRETPFLEYLENTRESSHSGFSVRPVARQGQVPCSIRAGCAGIDEIVENQDAVKQLVGAGRQVKCDNCAVMARIGTMPEPVSVGRQHGRFRQREKPERTIMTTSAANWAERGTPIK